MDLFSFSIFSHPDMSEHGLSTERNQGQAGCGAKTLFDQRLDIFIATVIQADGAGGLNVYTGQPYYTAKRKEKETAS